MKDGVFASLKDQGLVGEVFSRGILDRPLRETRAAGRTAAAPPAGGSSPLSGALGHYSAGFTLNTCAHAAAQMKQGAADTAGAVIGSQMYSVSDDKVNCDR